MALPTPVNGQITDAVTQTNQSDTPQVSNQTATQEKNDANKESKSDSKES